MQNGLLVDGLRKFGLTELEAKGYLALIERRTMSASEIAKISDLNRTTTYDVLNNLMDKGLCSLIPGKVKKYRALDLDFLADQIIEEKSMEFKKLNNQVNNIREEIKLKLKKLQDQSLSDVNPLEYVEVLRNPGLIHRKFMELCARTHKSVLSFTKPPFSHGSEAQRKEQHEMQKEIRSRGIKSRIIHEITFEAALEKFKDSEPQPNVEARIIDKLPMKLFIFDDRISYFTLEDPIPDRASLTMFMIDHPALVESLKVTFESYWDKATDISSLVTKK